MRSILFSVLALVAGGAQVVLAEPIIRAPATVPAGSVFVFELENPGEKRDILTIVEAEAPGGKIGTSHIYAHGDFGFITGTDERERKLTAPDLPGMYEIRYLSRDRKLITRQPIEVTEVSATLEAPAQVAAVAKVKVAWRGPANKGDTIAIVPREQPDSQASFESYGYPRDGKTGTLMLVAPEAEGAYEIRYYMGQSKRVLARVAVQVTGALATLKVPSEVMAGATFAVEWSGPGKAGDFIVLAAASSQGHDPDRIPAEPGRTHLELTAPDEAGPHELRYVSGEDGTVLAESAVLVTPARATIDAPEKVAGGRPFELSWTGPASPNDYLQLRQNEADVGSKWARASVRYGKTLRLLAPNYDGEIVLCYVTGKGQRCLASVPVKVSPPPPSGMIEVRRKPGRDGFEPPGALELILDASGSMLQREAGLRRIDIAKDALVELTKRALPAGLPVALRVFGTREANSCNTDLEVPLRPLDPAAVAATVERIQARNLAKTPIAESLKLVASDLAGAKGRLIVILVTDGEETCDGDPRAAIQSLLESGMDVRINIVGFAIDDYMLQETFEQWARQGRGRYFDGRTADDLATSLRDALRVPYEVVDGSGRVAGQGVVGGAPIAVPTGAYTVRALGGRSEVLGTVVVAQGQTALIEPEAAAIPR